MPHPPRADLDALVEALLDAGVQFIVVGGAAAGLHGGPITTQDLDIVHQRAPENVRRFSDLLMNSGLVDPPGTTAGTPSHRSNSGDELPFDARP